MTKKSDDLLDHYHLLAYEECDSTNAEARRLAQGGGAHGAVIWAKKQTHGHGRDGRPWVSTPGSLYVSFLLRPKCSLEQAAQLSFVASVAMAQALIPLLLPGQGELTLKWPNDLLFAHKKLGGILLESASGPNGEPDWVVVGVGINIDTAPDGLDQPTASLRQAGVELVSAKIVLSRFIHTFCNAYDEWKENGFVNIRKVWLRHAEGMKQPIEARIGAKTLHGTFDSLDAGGALVLLDAKGKKHALTSGEVFFQA